MTDTAIPDEQPALAKALQSAGRCLAFHPRDWAVDHRDAWLWGIVCGWPSEAMDECAAKFGWSDSDVADLRAMREAVRLITGESDDE